MGSPILKSDNREIQDFHLTTDIFQNTRDNKPTPTRFASSISNHRVRLRVKEIHIGTKSLSLFFVEGFEDIAMLMKERIYDGHCSE